MGGYGYGYGMGGFGGYNCRFCNPYMGCPMYCYNYNQQSGYGGMSGYNYPYDKSWAVDQDQNYPGYGQNYPGYGYRPNAEDCICDPYYGCQRNNYPYSGVMSLDKEKAEGKYYPGYGYRPHADDCICDPYYGCQCNDYPYGVTTLDKSEDKCYPGYGYRPHADDCICDPYYGCQCNDYPYGGAMSLDQAKPAEKTQGKYFYGPY